VEEAAFTILLAEDDPNDVLLTRLALSRAGIHNPIQIVQDGEEAMDYLSGCGNYADRKRYPIPRLALLDIKMPKSTGLEVLGWLRHQADETIRRLPVVIMSSSSEQKDIDRAYELGVNAYLVKPNAFKDLVEVLKTTAEFWIDTAAHPKV
jgi:CheY-like chemotaxis protein